MCAGSCNTLYYVIFNVRGVMTMHVTISYGEKYCIRTRRVHCICMPHVNLLSCLLRLVLFFAKIRNEKCKSVDTVV